MEDTLCKEEGGEGRRAASVRGGLRAKSSMDGGLGSDARACKSSEQLWPEAARSLKQRGLFHFCGLFRAAN